MESVGPTLVWVDGWQQQCCGSAIEVGGTVSWTLSPVSDRRWLGSVLGDERAAQIDFREEHHGGLPEDTPPTTARVLGVDAVRCRYAPQDGDPRTLVPVAGSGVTAPARRGDGFEPDQGDLRFVGYVVRVAP